MPRHPAPWASPVWSFSTDDSILVEGFESYNDDIDAATTIFDSWVDGWNVDENGSVVGYGKAPFAEQTIVLAGSQSMPFAYNNTITASCAEAELTFDEAQDWTKV